MCATGLSFRRPDPLQQDEEDGHRQRRLRLQAVIQGPPTRLVIAGLSGDLTSLTDLCTFSDKRHWDDAPLEHEQLVLRGLVPQKKKGGHLHIQSFQHGGQKSLDRRPGEDSVEPGSSQSRSEKGHQDPLLFPIRHKQNVRV